VKVNPKFGGQWKEKKKVPCYLFPLPLKQLSLNLHFLSFDLKFSLYHGPRPLLTPPLPFLAYKLRLRNLMSQVLPTFIINSILLKIFPPFLESMASFTITSYGPQTTQANEELPSESSLNLTLTQHLRNEELEPREVRARLQIEPPQAWYYCISRNSRTLVILLQVDPTSGDEPETIYEGCYEIEDTSIFARSSVTNVGYYH